MGCLHDVDEACDRYGTFAMDRDSSVDTDHQYYRDVVVGDVTWGQKGNEK